MESRLGRRGASRNTVLPNGVDRDRFRPEDRELARARLGWKPDERVVLFAADPNVARKRYWLARDAVEYAAGIEPTVRLEVATGVAPERMPTLMNAADCLVLTSVSEGSPNVVKEALAVNLPVVATAVGDVRELLAEVAPSAVCAASSWEIGEAIVECVRVPSRSNGRARSEALAAEAICDRLLALYDDLAPGVVETSSPGRGGTADA
jgi:glycosyltransferase involved in cell wall biosynthesis